MSVKSIALATPYRWLGEAFALCRAHVRILFGATCLMILVALLPSLLQVLIETALRPSASNRIGLQVFFLGLLGMKAAPLPRLLATDLAELRDGVPWFRSYTLPGKVHTILRSNAMYTAKVDNVLFRDWLQALVDDDTVEDVGETLLSARPRPDKR